MPARLHHQRIGAAPRAMLLTHGIYGAGGNWKRIAVELTTRRPDWAVELVDLRGHGKSENGAPPHTIAACADDLRALAAELGDIRVLAGHSFGGKCVLAARALVDVAQTWVLDASPSPRPHAAADPANTVMTVLAFLRREVHPWRDRAHFQSTAEAAGIAHEVAAWLAQSLVAAPAEQLALRLDLDQMSALLADYYATDLWAALEAPTPGDVHVVVAARDSALTAADQGRLAAAPPHVHVHPIDAGHWVHIDARPAVVELFATSLPGASATGARSA